MNLWNVNKEQKIEVSIGSMDFLVNEVTQNRRQIEVLSAENKVMNNFFIMFDRMGPPKVQGYGTDNFREAKKEFEDAVNKKLDKDKK